MLAFLGAKPGFSGGKRMSSSAAGFHCDRKILLFNIAVIGASEFLFQNEYQVLFALFRIRRMCSPDP
jgi:hypothetical protein